MELCAANFGLDNCAAARTQRMMNDLVPLSSVFPLLLEFPALCGPGTDF
jgi:hypothetical protein